MKKILALLLLLTAATLGYGQAISTNGGSIQGSVTDPTGAAVPGATVTISSPDTGYSKTLTTDAAGYYSIGPLVPGKYTITIASPSFEKVSVASVVKTGTVTSGSAKLTIGSAAETIEVNAGAVQVNTDQIAVSDVISSEQIKSLPVNGRNFLDLAQIEPGVILQSGESFDPTKAGYSAISLNGVSGRTTRIALDGQDITDETVGTTIVNVAAGSINEFQLNRSTQDLSGDVTSTGEVLVSTNSGTNRYHGQLFYDFQDARAGFASLTNGNNPPFQRNQYGASAGGFIIKDKLFFFADSERLQQASLAASPVLTGTGSYFSAIEQAHPSIPSPFHDTYTAARLDWSGPWGVHYFVRAFYEVNSDASNYGDGYWLYANRDNTPGLVGGADFQTGRFTHSFRYGYEKFHNLISDSTAGNTSIYNGIPGFTFYNTAQHLYSGPNYLAPQGTFQSDKQARYDGTWTHGAHTLHYGYSLNRVIGGGFASFFGLSPRASESVTTSAFGATTNSNTSSAGVAAKTLGCGGVVGAAQCLNDPLQGYSAAAVIVGNGQGSFTEKPAFGLPGDGVYDWRSGAYFGDSWKATPNLTVSAGVRWSVDTARANQDLVAPDCSTLDTGAFSSTPTCPTGSSIMSLWNPSYQGRVHQPWGNFGPQAGINYSPGNHKTSIRAGFGIYYESDVINNTTNARAAVIQQGAFFDDRAICSGYGSYDFIAPDGTDINSATVGGKTLSIQDICNVTPLGTAAPYFQSIFKQYASITAAHALAGNGGYIGETLNATGIYGAPYRTPYSEQYNFGVQHEVFRGAVLTVDYVHNATLKIEQEIDQNHQGAARYLNSAAAAHAISSTLTYCHAATIAAAIAPAGCAPTGTNPPAPYAASISDFASRGLDSAAVPYGGYPSTAYGVAPASGAAFAGVNPLLGSGAFLIPVGRSGYDALEVVFRQVSQHPLPGVVSSNLQMSYTMGRSVSTANVAGGDQFFSSLSFDNDNPTAYMGRTGLDHTNEFSIGGTLTAKYGPQFGVIGHFNSAAPGTLSLFSSSATASIFKTDITGDGTVNDLAPGTQPGSYMHRIKAGNLSSYISNFNATQAGKLTPAGQALVTAGLFTQAQLTTMGATVQSLAPIGGPVAPNNPAFRTVDFSMSYPIKLNRVREGLSLQPGINFYNVFNFSNFSSAPYSGSLQTGSTPLATAGYYQSPTSYSALNNYRVQRGSGTFSQGAPRSMEFQLMLNY